VVPFRRPACNCSMPGLMRHSFFPEIPCAGDRSTSQTTGSLLAVCSDMAGFLTAVILRETSLGLVRVYLDCIVAKTC
jgi:hypothetical protein